MLDRSPVVRSPRAQHSFRFENAWKLEPSFNDMIKESCLFYNDQSILNHLGRCAKDIYSWSLDHCNSLKKNIDECHKKKNCSSRSNNTSADQVQVLSLRKQMTKLLMQEDASWRQHDKTHWYKFGK